MTRREDFWTKEIVLERKVPFAFYDAVKRSWGDTTDPRDTYAIMSNPITSPDYISLIELFLEHPRARHLRIYDPSIENWEKIPVGEIDSKLAKRLADIVGNCWYNDEPFEMNFIPACEKSSGVEERARMKFKENEEGLIVGYKISVHRDNLDLFDSKISSPSELIVSAICYPRDSY